MGHRRTTLIVLGSVLVSAGLAVFLFGLDPREPAAQVAAAASDALFPATERHSKRERRRAIRSELETLADLQEAALEADRGFRSVEELPDMPPGLHLEVKEGVDAGSIIRSLPARPWWIGVLTHERSPAGEACAVTVNREPAYAAGIPLKQSGRVRCSWDLATHLNRLW